MRPGTYDPEGGSAGCLSRAPVVVVAEARRGRAWVGVTRTCRAQVRWRQIR